jgi:hypothetical protein
VKASPDNVHHFVPRIDILPKSADTLVEPRLESFMREQKADPFDALQGTLDIPLLRKLLFEPRQMTESGTLERLSDFAIDVILIPKREEAKLCDGCTN